MLANAAQFQVVIGILGNVSDYIAALYGRAFRDDYHGIIAGVAVTVCHD
jgi:hypothetical protein